MISLNRLQLDAWVQFTIGICCCLAWGFQWYSFIIIALWILWLWQTGSALELWLDYRHHSRKPYLWVAPLLFVSSFFFVYATQLILLCCLIYAWHTIRDYIIVKRRPRSFWDL